MTVKRTPLLVALLLCLSLGACSQQPQKTDQLYLALGAQAGLEQLVDSLLLEIEQDQQIVHHFQDTDIPRFRRLLIEQLCELSGGPCTYTGATMQESHTGFQISQADFDNLVTHLMTVMQRQKIDIKAQNQLLALLAPMYKDVVYR